MVSETSETGMSIKVMSYIWDHPIVDGPKGSELLLLLAIADHAADDGYCWPTIGILAAKIRMTERSVMRFVQALEKRGELYVVRSNRNNRYVVRMGRTDAQVEAVLEQRKESTGDKLSHDKMTRDSAVTSIGDTCVTSIGDNGVTLIISEPSMNHHDDEQKAFIEQTPPTEAADGRAWFLSLASLCVVDLTVATKAQTGLLGQSSKKLKDAGVTPEQIDAFGSWWYENDWRGKQDQPPTPSQVRSEWGKFMHAGGEGQRVHRLRR